VTRTLAAVVIACLAPLTMTAADISGKWTFQDRGGVQVNGKILPSGTHAADTITITLKADGNTLTGTVTNSRTRARNVPDTKQISHGRIDGDSFSFETTSVVLGTQMITRYAGTVDGEIIHITVKSGGGAGRAEAFDGHRTAE
jgi:hypothetical protein